MIDWVRRVAASDLSVIIQGESGTGKERVCGEIHRLSARGQGPFVAVNCGALPETLLEAELFGAARGAYTGSDRDRPGLFRLADGGTLFLDEVADMPPAMQAKLLRALQEQRVRPLGGAEEVKFDVRILAASHRNLVDQVQDGCFRSDLYFRLSVLRVEVPPLRARLDDLPGLVLDLAPRLLRETGLGPPRLSPGAWDVLLRHDWPGNIRELHSVLARALILSGGKELSARHVGAAAGPVLTARPSGRQLEREMILSALLSARGRIATAARSIGWSRQKLYRRIEALKIERPSFPDSPEAKEAADQSSTRGTTSSLSSTFQ
jgi:DNA-binding NtrC family response regulator